MMSINSLYQNQLSRAQSAPSFDRLNLPEHLGDVIGAMVDLQAGNVGGALQNLVDLSSNFTPQQLDRFVGGPSASFGRGYVPRYESNGPHLGSLANTYASREQVGKRAHIGQAYGYNWGPFELTGRITGDQYRGSFGKPIQLANGDYLYRGRTYDNMNSIWRDARDGRIDGQATNYRTWPGSAGFGAGQSITDLLGKIFGDLAGTNGAHGTNGTNGSNGASGSNGAVGSNAAGGGNELSQVLSDPNLSLEDKLAVLMAKLSEHIDQQIEGKMEEISKAMQSEGKGGQGGGSNPLGGIGSIAGGAVGTAFGGPFGGTIGSSLGSSLGSALGGSNGGASGGADGQKPNLQLLQTQLQQLVEKRTQMFQTMTSIFKSLHETSLAAIRNLKA